MPRRNLYLLLTVGLLSIICYYNVQKNPYGSVLTEAMDQIERRYLEPIGAGELLEGALEGMTSRLDPYSAYISPKMMQPLDELLDQEFGGVGMEVSLDPKTKQLTVISPLAGSPAYGAGIRGGDKILRIDDQSTQGMPLKDAVARLRGKQGEPVVLTVLHEGEKDPVQITIVRAVIQVDTVWGDTRNADGSWNYFLQGHDRIGYLRINSFGNKTAHELAGALEWLTQHQMRGLILDLRNDPGGALKGAIDVCSLFIDSGVIVTTRGRGGRIKRTYEVSHPGSFLNFPLAVLVNQYSASASEIVAACLQDHGRAVVVGQRTWGKGTVQELIDLGEREGTLKLTTSSYWRPSGRNIHRPKDATDRDAWGVLPDKGYEVVVDAEELARWIRWRLDRDALKPGGKNGPPGDKDQALPLVDRPLAKAVEYVEKAEGGSETLNDEGRTMTPRVAGGLRVLEGTVHDADRGA